MAPIRTPSLIEVRSTLYSDATAGGGTGEDSGTVFAIAP